MTRLTQERPPSRRERVAPPRFQLQAFRGAALSLLIITTFFLISVFLLPAPVSGFGALVNLAVVALFWGASLLLGGLLSQIIGGMGRISHRPRAMFLGAVLLTVILLQQTVPLIVNVLGVAALLVVITTVLGFGVHSLRILSRPKQPQGWRWAVGFTVVGGLGLAIMGGWLLWPGPVYQPEPLEVPGFISLPLSPTESGPYAVAEWSYGSSESRVLQSTGLEAVITPTVDLSALVSGWSGVRGWLRTWYWGFDATEIPLNAVVWHPVGEGPFPLVLIAHGNHRMDGQSHLGYGYLGEHLASRGYVVASLDHNFLNGAGGHEVILGGLQNDNNGRAYLFLKHLDLWHRWNQDEASSWYGQIDTSRIALMGHSRGGEAAATAAAMNKLTAHPGDARIPLDFNFDIGAVIAVAPADGQYMLRGEPTVLRDVDYLTLQGGADGDVRSFAGSRQFERIESSETRRHIACAVYVHGANHGQFNRMWGRVDLNFLLGFLNRGPIISRDEQERVAQVFVTAFLEASLRGQTDYEQVFSTPAVARAWIPDVSYVSQFMASDVEMIADFQEDADPLTGTVPGSRVLAEGLTEWRERQTALGDQGSRERAILHLAWDRHEAEAARWTLTLPSSAQLESGDALSLSVANRRVSSAALDFTLRLRDASGESAAITLSSISPLPPPFTYRMLKPPLQVAFEWEPVFSTYTIPLTHFVEADSSIDLSQIQEIELVFDQCAEGRMALYSLAWVRSEASGE